MGDIYNLFFNFNTMSKPVIVYCRRCEQEVCPLLSIKLLAVPKHVYEPNSNIKGMPRFHPQITAYCSECKRYIKHLPHTEEVIAEANDQLKINIKHNDKI